MAIVGKRTEVFGQAGLLFLPWVAYFALVWQYAQDIPHWDDYDAALGFLNAYVQNEDWGSRFRLLFSQHNEHRIFLTRIMTLMTYLVWGKVHFPTLIFLGNLFLLGSVWVLGLIHRDYFEGPVREWWYFVPVPFLMANLQFHENTIWAMASLQNFGVLLLGLGALFALHKASSWYRFAGALVLAAGAVYTSGNGMLVLLIGLWMVFKPGFTWGQRGAWILATLGLLSLYFWGYTSIPRKMSLSGLIGLRPELVLNFVLYYLGSWTSCFWGVWRLLSLLYGLGALLGLVYLLKIRYDRRAPLFFAIILFVLLSAGLTALGRASENLDSVFYSRYRVYSVLGLALLYWTFLDLYPKFFQKKQVWMAVLASAIFFHVASFWYGRPLLVQQSYHLAYGMASHQAGIAQPGLSYPASQRAGELLKEAQNLGIYDPKVVSSNVLNGKVNLSLPSDAKGFVEYAYEARIDTGYFRIDHGWAYLKGYSAYKARIYVVLQSETEALVYRTMRELRPDVSRAQKHPGLHNSGFTFFLPIDKLKPGYYKVGIYVQNVSWLFPFWMREGLGFGNYGLRVLENGVAEVLTSR